MSQTNLWRSKLQPTPVDDQPPALLLDAQRLGRMLIRLGMVSAAADHERPEDTLRDYCHPSDPEITFLRDMFTKSREEICHLWYGDVTNAARLASELRAGQIHGGER